MGRACELCRMSVSCADPKLHFSTKAEDIAFCDVVRASRYVEDCKRDVEMGREVETPSLETIMMLAEWGD